MDHRARVVWPLVVIVAAGCANQPPASPSTVANATATPAVASGSSSGGAVSRPSAESGGVSASCVGPLAEWHLAAADGSTMGGTCCPAFSTNGKLLRAEFCDIFTATGRFTSAQSFQWIDGEQVRTFRFVVDWPWSVDIVAQFTAPELGGQNVTAEGRARVGEKSTSRPCTLPDADPAIYAREHRWIFEATSLTHMGRTHGWLAFCPPL